MFKRMNFHSILRFGVISVLQYGGFSVPLLYLFGSMFIFWLDVLGNILSGNMNHEGTEVNLERSEVHPVRTEVNPVQAEVNQIRTEVNLLRTLVNLGSVRVDLVMNTGNLVRTKVS